MSLLLHPATFQAPSAAALLRRLKACFQNLRAGLQARHHSRSAYCRFASADEAWQVARGLLNPGASTKYFEPLSVLGLSLHKPLSLEGLRRALRKPQYTLRFRLGTASLEYQFFRARRLPGRTYIQCCLVEGKPFFIQLISAAKGPSAAMLTETLEKKYKVSLASQTAQHTIRDAFGAHLIISGGTQRALTYVFSEGFGIAAALNGSAPETSRRDERRKAYARIFAAL